MYLEYIEHAKGTEEHLRNVRLIVSSKPCLIWDVHVYKSLLTEQQGIKVLKIAGALSDILQIVIGSVIRM